MQTKRNATVNSTVKKEGRTIEQRYEMRVGYDTVHLRLAYIRESGNTVQPREDRMGALEGRAIFLSRPDMI